MPTTSPIFLACDTVGSVLPFSQLLTVLSDTPQAIARSFCVMWTFFRAAGSVILISPIPVTPFFLLRLNRNAILQ